MISVHIELFMYTHNDFHDFDILCHNLFPVQLIFYSICFSANKI